MTTKYPKDRLMVSVVTPVGEKITEENLRLTIESLENQTNPHFEWVIAFDGEPNNYDIFTEVMEDFPIMSKKYTEGVIRTVVTEMNYGQSVAKNLAVNISLGDIICYLDVGDTFSPERVQITQMFFKENNPLEILFMGYDVNHPSAGKSFYNPMNLVQKIRDKSQNLEGTTPLDIILRDGRIVSSVGVNHRRKAFFKVGGYQPGLIREEDTVMFRRMVEMTNPSRVLTCEYSGGVDNLLVGSQDDSTDRFGIGGFLLDEDHEDGSNGQYLDKEWRKYYNHITQYFGEA